MAVDHGVIQCGSRAKLLIMAVAIAAVVGAPIFLLRQSSISLDSTETLSRQYGAAVGWFSGVFEPWSAVSGFVSGVVGFFSIWIGITTVLITS